MHQESSFEDRLNKLMLRKIDEGIAVIKPMAWKGRGGPEKLNP
jgi:hypothetical protein